MKMIELHNQDYLKGKHGFSLEMNAFGDLVSVTWVAAHHASSLQYLVQSHPSFEMICLFFLEDQYRIQGIDDWLSKHGTQ